VTEVRRRVEDVVGDAQRVRDVAVRVSAGGVNAVLGRGDMVMLVSSSGTEGREVAERQAVFFYVPSVLYGRANRSAKDLVVPLGKAARQDSRVGIRHEAGFLVVSGKDFHIGAGSGVMHLENGALVVPLETSFSVEAAGYWAHFGADWRSVQTPRGDPAERFTVEVFRVSPGGGRRKAAEIQLETGDMVVVERCSRAGCEEDYIISKTTTYASRLAQDVESLAKMNRENRKAAESEEVIYSEPPATHLTLEVPHGGGIVVQDYGHKNQGSTSGTELILEDLDGKHMTLMLQKNRIRFYPAPSKGLSIKLGTGVLLHIEASH